MENSSDRARSKTLPAVAVLSVFLMACSGGPGKARIDMNQLSLELLEKAALPPAVRLVPVRKIRFGEGEVAGVAFPSALAFYDEDRLLVVDNPGGRVVRLTLVGEEAWAKEQHSGLEAPYRIRVQDGTIFLKTNRGIRSYTGIEDREGSLTKVFYATSDFEPAEEGIYLATRHAPPQPTEPLLVLITPAGEPLAEWGLCHHEPTLRDLDNNVFLTVSKDHVIPVYQYLPEFSILARSDGSEERRAAVRHPIFKQLIEKVRPHRTPNPHTTVAPQFTAGAKVVGDRLYVLLHLPYLEVVEYSLEGSETARYRLRHPGLNIRNYGGFDVQLSSQGLRFAAVVIGREANGALLFLLEAGSDGPSPTGLGDPSARHQES